MPNYDNPVTRGHGVLIGNIAISSLSTLAVGLRLYTRIHITRTLGLDDAFSVLGLGTAIAMCIVQCISIEHFGWNRHVWDIPLPAITDGTRLNIISMLLFGFSSTFIRVSLLWFFFRLLGPGFRTDIRVLKYCLMIAIMVVSALAIVFALLLLFQCT
jgi:hypothetical protein